jgi:hypothetical protein
MWPRGPRSGDPLTLREDARGRDAGVGGTDAPAERSHVPHRGGDAGSTGAKQSEYQLLDFCLNSCLTRNRIF